MKKKWISLLLINSLFVGILGGCSGNDEDTETDSVSITEQETEPDTESANSNADTLVFDLSGVTKTKTISVDGDKALSDEVQLYDGLGMISANGSSRLLLDYKAENPEAYWEILEYLFGENGMGLSLIKIEMGADVDSSSGTEPAVMRSEDEEADVTRGAGYQLAADALTINPDIQIDLLYWGMPAWVNDAEDVYAAKYEWYKATIDAMYDTYGIKVSYVTVTQNERAGDAEWIKYFSQTLKAETDERYDYDTIRIVAGEGVCEWKIADKMLEDEELMDAVDVVTAHYTSWTTDSVKTLQTEYGKEVWFSEGSSPMSYAASTYQYDGTGSGMSDLNGMLDIATRITQAMTEGMTMYEFQPAVSAYYSGVTYFPKQLITANEPWSGAYSLDAGFYMVLHFSQFIDTGWRYVGDACYGDGVAGGDGHAIVDSTYNYITCIDETGDNCSLVLVNNSEETIEYSISLTNLNCIDSTFYVWETRGPDEDDEDYYANYFKKLGKLQPEDGNLTVVLQPWSMMTVSTVDVEETGYGQNESSVLELPYEDDFEYEEYDENYLADRGYAPRYTTDQGGAFEVEETDEGNVLMQKITYENKPADWGSTSDPTTNLGDDRWFNYTVSLDVHFTDETVESTKANYVGIGARYNLADANYSGYWIKLWEDGTCDLMKNSQTLLSETVSDLDTTAWHALELTVCENTITASVDGEEIFRYTDTESVVNSGRVAIYSSYQNNYFDNLKVEALDGEETSVTRIDDLDAEITYSEGGNVEGEAGWYHNTMCSYKNYNRTVSDGTEGAWLEFSYSGGGFAVLGTSSDAVIQVEIDGETAEEAYAASGAPRQTTYYNYGLDDGEHTVKITVISGTFEVDAIEY